MAIKKIIVTMLMSLLLLTTLHVKTVKAYSYQEFLNNCSESYQTGTYFKNLKKVLEEKAPTMAGTADLVIEVARSQIGYYEGDNSSQLNGVYHGSNDYTEYGRYGGYGNSKGGWCNVFVSWCLDAAGTNVTYTNTRNAYYIDIAKVGGVYSWADYIDNKFEFEKGDIIIYSSSKSTSISGKNIPKIPTGGHVAIFDKKINGKYNTIDGNTNGDGVCVDEKFRTFDPSTGEAWTNTYVYMVIRPNYVSSCNHLIDPNSEINKTGYCSEHDTWLPIEDDNYKYNQDGSLFVPGTYKEKVVNGSSVAIYRNQPYKSSPSLNINFSTVEVIGCVKNGLGNVWYKVKNGTNTYYCFSENLEFVSPIDSTLSINPEHETYTIQKGTKCDVRGTISSNYNITRVTATLNGTKYVDKNPNSKSFDIGTSSAGYINSFKGAELPVGDNYIIITATDASGKTIPKTITIKVEDNSQLTPATYQIIYNANEGSSVPNNQTKTQGVPLYLSTTIPTREHHTFLGYSTYLGGPIVYQPGDAYTADSGATLYANWTYNYGFQVIGVLDGATTYSTAEYGTYDIYINGSLVAQNATDYWNEFPSGTTYDVVLHLDEHYWLDTVNSSSLSGTIQDHTPIYLGINTNIYPLDLNAFIDGQYKPMLGEGVTCDLYINGQLEAEGISDHYQYYKYGTSYEFKNFRSTEELALETIATAEEYNNDSYKDRIGIVDGPTNVNVKMHTCFENSNDYRDNISKIEKFNGHTYLYFDSKLSWYDANSICKLLGGHLVTLTSEEENSFVDNFTEHNIIWTGGLCNANREWKWINNEVFQYSNWDMNWGLAQPNNGDAPDAIEGCEEYIILNFNEFSKGKWHDDAGSHVWNFVCEIDDDINEFVAKTKKCGENAMYTITDDNVLFITGNGDIYNYSINNKAPWHDYGIEQVIIEDGIASIGDFTFYGCSNLTSLTIPDSVTSIGDYAFYECNNLVSIKLSPNVTWSNDSYLPSGNWTNGSITYTAEELHDNWNFSLAGTWLKGDAESVKYLGEAYGIIDEEKNLTLFRSTDNYLGSADAVYSDIAYDIYGNKYIGHIITDIESDKELSPSHIDSPWWDYNIKTFKIASNQKIKPKTTAEWFMYEAPISVDLTGLDCSEVTNMAFMFKECDLRELDLSPIDTSNVADMSYMFEDSSLVSINLSSFDTRSVTNMLHMFSGCRMLTSLDVSSFDTSNVTNMSGMFMGCELLSSLNLSSFNTSKVTDMSDMFRACKSFTSLDLSSFDTSNVKDMSTMLYASCWYLYSLDLSSFNTSNVESMGLMFGQCASLVDLDISSFDCSNLIRDGSSRFDGLRDLLSINLGPKFIWRKNEKLPSGNWTNGSITYTAEELRDNWNSSLAGTWKKIDEKVSNKVANGTLEQNGTISLKVTCEIDESVDRDNAYVLINNEKTYLKDLNSDGNNYTLKIPQLSPTHLSDSFTVTYYDENDKPISNNITISVKSYINTLINDENTSTKAKTFYKSLLNYAANAQEYFGFNTEDLANSELLEVDKDISNVNKEEVAEYAPSIAGVTEGIRAFGQDLNLSDEINYRVYFQLEDGYNINEYAFTLDGVNVQPQKYKDNLYYVNTKYHAAPDLGVTHNIAVTRNNEGSLNVSVSVISYAHLVLRNEPTSTSDIKLQNLMKSLYLYYNNAKQMLEG